MTAEKLVAGPLRGVAEAHSKLNAFVHWLDLQTRRTSDVRWGTAADRLAPIVNELAEALASLPSSPPHYIVFATADDQQAASTILADGQRAEGAEARVDDFEELFYEAFTEDRDADMNADPLTLGERCKKYAAKAVTLRGRVLPAAPPVAEKTELGQAPAPKKHDLNAYDDLQCKNCGLGVGHWPSKPECAALGSGQELRERIERVISAGDDLRYDEYGVMEMPIGHLATKWDIAKAELEAALALPLAPKVPDERET